MEYTKLGNSGLTIAKIIVGCMSYGSSKWQGWVLDEEESIAMLKKAYDAGMTTWDTADVYSNGVSERVVRKTLERYNIPRRKVVILSKCYFYFNEEEDSTQLELAPNVNFQPNEWGLSRKHIFDAVERSVDRLGTYIDVLQIHRVDNTPDKEIMHALNDVVNSGKVRYIGASSMPAWRFQSLQNTAEKHNWHKFVSMQNYINLVYREEEREMIPYCQATGVGMIPWSPVARGLLTRPYHQDVQSERDTHDKFKTVIKNQDAENDEVIVGRVEKVAKDRGVSMAIVAIAWTLSKKFVNPIVGLNKPERVDEAVKAISFKLTEEEIKFLEESYRPRPIFGHVA